MNKLTGWLEKELFGWRLCLFMLGSLAVIFVHSAFISNISPFFNLTQPSPDDFWTDLPILRTFIVYTFYAAIFEEMLFRMPLAIAAEFCRPKTIVILVIVLSIIFGYLHGSFHHIYFQGAHGLVYSVIFLKAGGFQRRPFKALLAATIIHASYNLALPFGILEFLRQSV